MFQAPEHRVSNSTDGTGTASHKRSVWPRILPVAVQGFTGPDPDPWDCLRFNSFLHLSAASTLPSAS